MFWRRMLIVVWLLSPALGWGAEPDVQSAQELIAKLKDADPTVRGKSIRALAKFGPEARAAIPALIEALPDTESFNDRFGRFSISTAAYQTLYDVGIEAIPALTIAVDSTKPHVGHSAIDCLARFGPRARSSLEAIVKVLSDPDRDNHFSACAALSRIDADGTVAVPILERYFNTKSIAKDDYGQGMVIELLGRYPNHPRTLPMLLAALKHSNPEVRGGAVQALTDMRGRSQQIIPALLPLLHDRGLKTKFEMSAHCATVDRQGVWRYAAIALALQGAPGEKVVPELLQELENPDPKEVHNSNAKAVLWQILEFSAFPPGTAARLLRCYEQAVDRRRETMKLEKFDQYEVTAELLAIASLARMPRQTAEFTAKWKTWLKSPDEYQRFEAAIILATIDPDQNQDAVDHLLEVINLASEEFDFDISFELRRRRAVRFPKAWSDLIPKFAVGSLLSNPKLVEKFLPDLAEWCRKGLVPWDNPAFMRSFKRLQPEAAYVAQALLEKSYPESCLTAIRTLGPDIVPILIANAREALEVYQASSEQDDWTSSQYLELLPDWPTAAVTAWPVILEYANSPNPHFRAAAYEALGKIPGLHDTARPELLKGLQDPRCIVRVAAAHGLGLISGQNRVVCPALMRALADDFADVRGAALESLVKLGVDEPGVRDAIQKLTQDPHSYVRLLATDVLSPKKP
ncbi:MAG: putative lyase [Planctomycetaceae bacterium]|nr:putative lyase [Planctomycetaceae bacterium]